MFELSVALKHITVRRRQTLLAVVAIGLAVAIAILFRSLMNGSLDSFFEIFFDLAPHIWVDPKEDETFIYLYKTLMETIWAIPGVAGVSPLLETNANLAYEDNVENAGLTGVIPAELNKVLNIGGKYMVEGDLDSIQNGRRIVLGRDVADELEVELGETIEASRSGANTLNLVVVGIFDTGIEEWDGMGFVSLETAGDFMGVGDVITGINIQLEEPYRADAVAAEISALGYDAQSWRTMFPEFEEAINLEKFSNNLILILVMIIAAFGIGNVMNMLVLEKTREIGMLMAMGSSPSNIRRVFLFESGILGLTGGICGSVLGYFVSVYLHSQEFVVTAPTAPQPIVIKFLVNPWDLVAFTLLALALSMVAGVYPAHKASRLDPVVALRG